MHEFRHSTNEPKQAFFEIVKVNERYHISYNCIVNNDAETKWLYGITLKTVIDIYKAWCVDHGLIAFEVAKLFEPYCIDELWSDLDEITIDDEKIIP